MHARIPTLPVVLLSVIGLWMIIAAFGTLIPTFVTDRVPKQIIPVTEWFFSRAGVDLTSRGAQEQWGPTIKTIAHIFQGIIAATEFIVGVTALAAASIPRRRLQLANFSLGLGSGLFGAFLLTMFAIHSKDLPAWNQYPAIFAWFGVTWLVVVAWEKGWTATCANAPTPR
jgi:hypothetical protein